MSNKTIGKDIANPIQREQFIKDNADGVENKGYMKHIPRISCKDIKKNLPTCPLRLRRLKRS